MVMIFVMMILAMLTATGVYVVSTTTTELRAAGHLARNAQTEYLSQGTAEVAVATVFDMGSENLLRKLREDREDNANAQVNMRGLEPEYLSTQQDVGRLTAADFALVGDDSSNVLRPHSAYEHTSWVDVNDVFVTELNRAGERAGHGAPAVQLHIVYTARSRLRVSSAFDTTSDSLDFGRQRAEVAGAYRLFALQTDYPSGRL